MMSSDDDDVEPRLKAVENYYFVDDDDAPVPFDVLPFQFNAAEEVPSFKKDVYLRGFTDGGLQKVYKQVVAWKLGLDGKSPEITVLSTEGSWIVLLKPRSSYEQTVRSVLITVEMLHFVRRSPIVPDEEMWDHLHVVFGKYDVRPSAVDFRNHVRLIKMFAERDPAIAKSQTLQQFIKENTLEKIDKVSQCTVKKIDDVAQNTVEKADKVAQNTVEKVDKVAQNTVEKFDKVGSDDLDVKHPFIADDEEREEMVEDDSKHESCNDDDEVDDDEEEGDLFDSVCAICDNGGELLCCEGSCMRSFHAKIGDGEDSYCATLGYTESELEAIKIFLCKNCEYKQHQCFVCGVLEPSDGPNAKALPKILPQEIEISFEEIDEAGVITRAWELSKRILIYCLDHDMDLDIGTPARDHLKFPRIAKPVHPVKRKVKELAEKKRQTFDDSYVDEPVQKSSRMVVTKRSLEQPVSKPVKKKAKYLKEMIRPEESVLECHAVANQPKQPAKDEFTTLSLPATGKTPQSSFPVVDTETEKRVIALVEKEVSSLTLDDISRRCAIPSTYASSGRQIDKIIAQGKLERSVQAVQAALQKLENGGTVDDAKAVCEVEVLRQITRWNTKLRVYLAPFIHGTRYTSFGRHFTKKEKLIEIVDKLHWYVQPGDTIVDFSCGLNDFSKFMKEKLDKVGKKCNFKNFDVIRPKNSFCFEKRDWMTVRPKELPHGSKLIMGLNPPFGMKAMLANKFIDKALSFKPKLIVLIVPKETERLDQKRQPYDLVWEDTGSLSGRSFYLPGSVDVTDKQMDQWNVSPPPLYLWSRTDWTQKHKKIAEEHGHTTLKVVSHSEEMDYCLDDFCRQNYDEVPYEQRERYGEKKDTYMTENINIVGKPERVNGLPAEKLVEVGYEETKVASDRGGTFRANQSGIHFQERVAHSDFRIDRYNDGIEAIEVSNSSRWRRESEKTDDATKADSDMSISPSDSRNSQYKSRSDSPHMTSEYSSERVAHQDIYFNDPIREPCTSFERVPYEDYIRNVAEYGVASVEKHLAISTSNVGAGLMMHSTDIDELTGDYAGGPNSNFYTAASGGTSDSFYRIQNLQDSSVDHTLERTSPAPRNVVAGRNVDDARMYGLIRGDHTQPTTTAADIRAHIRMYGGHTGDGHPQTAMNAPAPDIRAQIRMYGRQSTPTSGYSRSSDPQSALTGFDSYGISSLDSTGRSPMGRYAPRLHETNYTTGSCNDPDDRRNMTPDPLAFGSRQQCPYPYQGPPGGWPG
ncbi:hypothetical protein EJB05_49787 [Eragrostis curvula]|uniref:Uncharacterized protein n=1 Tax=Eragrostis curvula TaxID=38414 RepID=A0A5J9T5B0_9POAL|nr:hypothetical protein EJB05_49787 [Eragrostis curvula]